MKRTLLVFLLALALVAAAGFAFQAARTANRAASLKGPAALTTLLPQGALLTIESPDFGALLKRWNTSRGQQAWLASANYSVFSNSRLFGRLADAQTEFAATAGIPAGALLPQLAGRQSVFAWYDIGHLEFLYVTRLTPAQQSRTQLVEQRGKWKRREAAGIAFYLRSTTAPGASIERTVAFATAGDLMLLATREDLLVGALTQLAHPVPAAALPAEPWFADASAALPAGPTLPALHMVLNLDRLVPSPYFRSYWVQQNISQMKLYRAAVSDLYLQENRFEDQRALLLRNDPNSPPVGLPTVNLGALAALAPAGGVFRAAATSDPAQAVTALEEKLLGREPLAHGPAEQAPDPSLSGPEAGADAASANDLETRIDTPPPVSATFSNQALTTAIHAAGLEAVLTWSTATLPAAGQPGKTTSLWVPIHSVVVLRAQRPWGAQALTAALEQSLRGTLTASTLGLGFTQAAGDIYTLAGPKPLVFALRGTDAFLADDAATLSQLLAASQTPGRPGTNPPAEPVPLTATLIAGFDHAGQRHPFERLTSLIDGPAGAPAGSTPNFFSGNIASLSQAFAALQAERFTEFHEGSIVRQTVTYSFIPER